MAEECADFVGGFRRQDVFELAGLLLDFGLAVHGQRIGKEAFCQTMTPDNVGGALVSTWRELDDGGAIASRNTGRLERVMAGIDERLVIVGFGWMRTHCH